MFHPFCLIELKDIVGVVIYLSIGCPFFIGSIYPYLLPNFYNMAEDSRKCPKCFMDIPKKAKLCPNCKSDLRNWFVRHPIITFFIVVVILWPLLEWKNQQIQKNTTETLKQQQISQVEKPETLIVQKQEIKPEVVEKMNIAVTSIIVKKVDWKCRYFFDIRNNDKRPYVWWVKINLINAKWSNTWNDKFNTTSPIAPKLWTTVYLEASTCPVALHWEYWINSYTFDVFENDKIVNSWSWMISDKFENYDS